MDKLRYSTVTDKDLGGGIDARSSENIIPPGFSSDILNGDTIESRIIKRAGYQGVSGNLPVRVKSVEFTNTVAEPNKIIFELDSSIDLLSVRSSPLVVYGRTSSTTGSVIDTADSVHYYPEFLVDPRIPMPASGTSITVSATDHQRTTANLFVGTVESTSTVNLSHTTFIPDGLLVNNSTYDVEMQYSEDIDRDALLYFAEKDSSIGSVHVLDTSVPLSIDTDSVVGNIRTLTVGAVTHQLNNFQIVPEFYHIPAASTTRRRILPSSMVISNTGLVTVTFDSTAYPLGDILTEHIIVILSSAPTANILAGQIADGTTDTVSLSPITDSTQKFPFTASYLIDPGTNDAELVIASRVVYDDDITDLDGVRDLSVEFTNDTGGARNYEVYYEFGSIVTNRLEVFDSAQSVDGITDTSPQLTIWGLSHSNIYGGSSVSQEGWVTHIDSYRRSAEARLVTGLGGNLFASRTYEEVGSTYSIPQLYPRLRNRVDTNTIISPLVHGTGDTPGRARGYLTVTAGSDGWLDLTDINWAGSGNSVVYTLDAPALATFDSADSPTVVTDLISSGLLSTGDQIQVDNTGYSRHNGTFIIDSAVVSGSNILITVTNPLVDNADYDETDVGGRGGVFTDRIPLNSLSEFVGGDQINSGAFSTAELHTVVSTTEDSAILVDGVSTTLELAAGVRVNGLRTSSLIPLRTVTGDSNSTGFVEGDTLRYTGIDRLLHIKSVHPRADISISSIVGDGTTAVINIPSTPLLNTTPLSVGDSILLLRAGEYTGTSVITQITDLDTFEISHSGTTSILAPVAAVLAGNTVEVDESFEWEDDQSSTITLTTDSRWIPIEAPRGGGDQVVDTYISHLDSSNYINQSPLRSTMSSNNMYFTNGADEVMKFDGSSIYRAGLFRWQPGLFVTTDTAATGGKIELDPLEVDESAAAVTNKFSVSNGGSTNLSIGDQVIHSEDGAKYTITNIVSPDTGSDIIYVDRTITGTAGTGKLSTITTFTYYFRLNAIDANSNQIASAVTGANDFVVELSEDAAVEIKLVGMPTWGIYDYDRLELEVYRTRGNTSAPFYRIATLPLSFDADSGYIRYVDTNSDDVLTTLDPVNSSILGAEIGTTWSEPMRAKYITSADNRLILGNLRDYPELDIQIETDTSITRDVFLSTFSGLPNTGESNGKRFLFRRDSEDVGTSTDMLNRAAYQFVDNTNEVPITGISTSPSNYVFLNTSAAHGLTTGNWIYLYNTSSVPNLLLSGWYQIVESFNSTTFTIYTNDNDNITGLLGSLRYVTASDPMDIPVLLGQDFNRQGIKFGNSSTPRIEAMSRLGEAINASMRMTNTADNISGAGKAIPAMEGFVPWIIANSGGEFRAGQLIVRQPRVESTTLEVVLPSRFDIRDNSTTNVVEQSFRVAVNDIFRTPSEQAGAREKVFPSRIIRSYPNFPEIFDAPNVASSTDSDSISDANSSDGQELTGIVPFFGDSVTSAAQLEGIVLVTKENSIYVFNVASRAIQKLETQGVGCTAPYSLVPSSGGINFATNSGIYQITRNFQLRYLGRRMERPYSTSVNRDRLDLVHGHQYILGRQYKLSVPIGSDSNSNSEVYVYDHTREMRGGEGAWTRYDNHPATGWANLSRDAYFSSTSGRVFSIRRVGDGTDYRDDSSAISLDVKLRPNDFGDSAIRKRCSGVVTHLRATVDTKGTRLLVSRDLQEDFESTEFIYTPHTGTSTGISDGVDRTIISVRSSMNRNRFVYLQLRYTNSTLDEPVEIAGVDYRIAGLSSDGVVDAGSLTP